MASPVQSPKAKKATFAVTPPAAATPDRKPTGGPGTPGRGLLPREYGDSYMTFNPGLLDDKDLFTKKTLKKICDNVKIPAEGLDREDMIKKLRKWHALRMDGKKHCKGNNFALLRVKESDLKDQYKSPFKKMNNFDTPRSILKTSSRFASPPAAKTPLSRALKTPKSRASAASSDSEAAFQSPMSPSEYKEDGAASDEASPQMELAEGYRAPPSPQTPAGGVTPASKKRSRICFSPYNQVRIMSPCRPTPSETDESTVKKGTPSDGAASGSVSRRLSVGTEDSEESRSVPSKRPRRS